MIRRRHIALTVVIGILALFAMTERMLAHPTAQSFVVVEVPAAGPATVRITTDARALLLKLDERDIPSSDQEVDRRLRALGAAIADRSFLEFDGERTPLRLQAIERVMSAASSRVRISLTGDADTNATAVAWRTSLFTGTYPLAVRPGPGLESEVTDDYEWLSGPERSRSYSLAEVPGRESWWRRAGRVVGVGFTHIVPGGLDHVLFVLGLFLLARNARALLLQISAFTVAHSVTLAAATLGWVTAPPAIIEPLIALSIAYIAIENLFARRLTAGRIAIVFAFGLLHGLGFAGALSELGFGSGELSATLVGFNVGVELGQLAVVAAASLFVRALALRPDAQQKLIVRPVSVAIAATGVFWAIERL